MKKALFFFAGSKGMGLTSLFSDIFIDLFRRGSKKGFDVYIVSDKKEQNPGLWEKIEHNIPAGYIIKYDENHPENIVKLLKEKTVPYEKCVLHMQGISHIQLAKELLKQDKIKGAVTIHSFSNGNWKRSIVSCIYSKYINKYIDKAIFSSPFAINHFTGSRKLMKKGKIAHIPFNLPPLATQYEKTDDGILNPDQYNIVYLANFFKNKGHEKYLPAIIRFAKENPDARIYFFGDGVRRQAVIDQIKSLGADGQIFCPGRIPRNIVPSILEKTSAALVLSENETFGHCILEPIMMGVPTVSTRVGCGEYLIQDYINGIGINSSADLYKALTLLKSTPELGRQMAENGKRMVESFYKYQNMLDAYFELYDSL